jgi:hypothetical protein
VGIGSLVGEDEGRVEVEQGGGDARVIPELVKRSDLQEVAPHLLTV